MINYKQTAFGLGTLFRLQGSAYYRSCFLGMCSVGLFLLIRDYWDNGQVDHNTDELLHPYAVGVLVAGLTFLLVFRCQAAYARYWEATGNVFQMMSKWLDVASHTATFHLQCEHYKAIKPPVFFDYPSLNAFCLTRDKEIEGDEGFVVSKSHFDPKQIGIRSASARSIELPSEKHLSQCLRRTNSSKQNIFQTTDPNHSNPQTTRRVFQGQPRLDGGWGLLYDDGKATFYDPTNPYQDVPPKEGFGSTQGGRSVPLFLQELAHLTSLLLAVAFSTLRNDIEGSDSPLGVYAAGSEWPEVDPVMTHGKIDLEPSYWGKFCNFLGRGRSAGHLIRYNASRPLPVIGGVSQAEIHFIQMARGPYAKTQLCCQWLSEFIIREHLAGSTGAVGPPIICRVLQLLSDGMVYYNSSRKIMFVPFPFPHAQLSIIYILVAVPAIAFLMDQYTQKEWVGALLTFLTVTCLSGIHEVARELENPFRNVPNEIPLVTFMAQFNEGLLTTYSGYHPDFFWKERAEHCNKPPPPFQPKSEMWNEFGHSATPLPEKLKSSSADETEYQGVPLSASNPKVPLLETRPGVMSKHTMEGIGWSNCRTTRGVTEYSL